MRSRMSFTRNSNIIKSPKLQGAIVENILLLCKKELAIDDLSFEIQRKMQLSCKHLKKHLVHLIDYELVTYNCQRKVSLIEDEGFEILDWINREKDEEMIDSEDILITIEKESQKLIQGTMQEGIGQCLCSDYLSKK